MKRTRRDRTVQSELNRWRWWEMRDLKQRWKMKQREKTERRRSAVTNDKTATSKAKLMEKLEYKEKNKKKNKKKENSFFFFFFFFLGKKCYLSSQNSWLLL
ncbi:hypothetical protein TorRG33x02_229470 [Trema orientale]|uniref:Uncharacterized protein n=1 Tax=Trema orientale TaxID=63057 RepID=A0A2P5E6M6_TREOI|nr:hypothetical protein TorRG33x02_229470 [Trema orientale]